MQAYLNASFTTASSVIANSCLSWQTAFFSSVFILSSHVFKVQFFQRIFPNTQMSDSPSSGFFL